jgi:hypothetical protein
VVTVAERWTKTQAHEAFELLARRLGKNTTPGEIGRWRLEFSSYGGYVITQLSNNGGGESCPFGEQRRSAKDFCSHVHFTLRALELFERAQAQNNL